jgi:peptidoglycan/xylan/chitin deacetylase (PgdA/CDA1 family)
MVCVMIFDTLNKVFNHSSSHILLYHSTFRKVPSDLFGEIHNVTPDEFYKQLKWLKSHFDVVAVDELLCLKDLKGKAAITFDDAYKSVFEEALPMLKSLNMPCTIFINGCTLDKRVFWRDKVRYIINAALVSEFIESNKQFCKTYCIDENNFYRRTKHHELNSIEVESLLDKFFKVKGIRLELLSYCIDDPSILSSHDLVSYGSHSYSHYVMSSLTKEQQHEEVVKNINFFNKHNIKHSQIFSIPFGDENSFDDTTIALLDQYNYKGFVYSRNRLNSVFMNRYASDGSSSIYFSDRYMPRSSFSSFQSQIAVLNFRKMLGFHRVRQ